MNFKRIGRILVCLLLVCCLLVTCPPGQAYAMTPGVAAAIIIGVPAALVIGSSLIGQGILPGIGDAFNNLINDIKMSVAVQRFIYDDKIDVLASTNTATDETQYYVSQDVLEAVQEAAFETGAISISVPDIPVLRAGNAIISNGRHYSAPVDTYVFAIYPSAGHSACFLYLVSTEPFSTWVESWYNGTMDFEKKASSFEYNEVTYYYANSSVSSTDYLSSIGIVTSGSTTEYIGKVLSGELSYGETQITLADGLEKGTVIGDVTVDLSEVYTEWYKNSQEYDDENNKLHPYWPIGLPGKLEDLENMAQEDVWSGISEYTEQTLTNWEQLLQFISDCKVKIPQFLRSLLNIETWVNWVADAITEIKNECLEFFEFVKEKFLYLVDLIKNLSLSIFQPILDALKDAFLVRDDYFESKIDTLRQRYSFVNSIYSFCIGVGDLGMSIGSKPPIIYVDLGAAEGAHVWGERVVFLDLTWYSRYKPAGDAIISAFLWAMFGWRMLHYLPGLVNGASGVVGDFKSRFGG